MDKRTVGLGVMFQSLLYVTVGNIVETSYSPLDKIIKDHFLASAAAVGLLTSIIFIGLAGVAPFVGFFVDHLGSFRAIKIGFLIMAAGSTISAVSSSYTIFAMGFLFIGAGYGILTPATNNAVMNTYFPNHATPMGIKQSGVPIGASVSAIILPLLFLHFNFYAPFIFLALVSILFALITRGEPVEKTHKTDIRSYMKELKGTFRNRRFLIVNVLVAVMSWGQQALLTFAVLFAISLGYGLFQAEGLLASILIGSLTGRIFWSWLSSRIFTERRIYSLIMVMFIAALMFFIYSLQFHFLLLSIPVFFFTGFTAIGWNGVYITVISETAPKRQIGMYSAIGLLVISVGTIIGTPLSGIIVDASFSYIPVWRYLSVAMALVALVLLMYSRTFQKAPTTLPA